MFIMLLMLYVLWEISLAMETPPTSVPLICQKRLTKSIILLFFFKTDEKTYSQRTTYSIGALVNRLVLTC